MSGARRDPVAARRSAPVHGRPRAWAVPVTALAAGLVLGGCASAPEPLEARELEGCFYFDQSMQPDSVRLPWGVRFSEDPLEGWPALAGREDVFVAATLTVDGDQDHPFGYWSPSQDSVTVGYPAGGGLVLELEVGDTALAGLARPLGDARAFGSADPEPVAVRLTRARCPED